MRSVRLLPQVLSTGAILARWSAIRVHHRICVLESRPAARCFATAGVGSSPLWAGQTWPPEWPAPQAQAVGTARAHPVGRAPAIWCPLGAGLLATAPPR